MSVSSEKTIILIDSSFRFEEIKQFANMNDIHIITFDYESHKKLSEAKIQHEISDIYLEESDLSTIQDESYRFSKWFDEPSITKSLLYEDHNLGELFYPEFHYFIVPFLKKFVEIKNITAKFTQDKFISSYGLYEIAQSFIGNIKKLSKSKDDEEFLYDFVKISLQIKNISLSFNLSKKYYLKIKTMSERFVDLLFGARKNNDNAKKTVLFVEFDTLKYKKIFETLPNSSLDAIFYSRRRPVVWNAKSFSIVRRSKCKVATSYTVGNKEVESKIQRNTTLLLSQIDSLWKNETFFQSFFTIKAISFWKSMKPKFIEVCKKRMIEGIREIELAKQLFEKFKFDSVVVWSENGLNEQIILKIAAKQKIPVILIQHGLYYDTKEALPFNKFAGIFPFHSDNFVVWGESLKQYAINCGIQENKIKVLGSPMYDEIFQNKKPNNLTNNKFILLATSGPNNHFINDLMIENNDVYEKCIEKICKTVTSMGYDLVIKLHPSSVEVDITELAKKINPEIIIIKAGSILPLIASSIVVIVIDISTAILESQILERPVVSMSVKNFGFGIPTVFSSNSCVQTDLDDFEKIMEKTLNDDEFRKQTISKGTDYVNNYFVNGGMASEKLLSFLEKFNP